MDIENYSNFLLKSDNKQEIISDFDFLSELRGWMWENYFMTKKNTPSEYDNVLSELRKIIESISDKYDLLFITD